MMRPIRSSCRRATGAVALALLAQGVSATTHYVVMPGTPGVTPTPPYASWETAGTDLVAVVSVAMTNAGVKRVWVADGTYYPTNTIIASGGLVLRSVNGRDATVVDGRGNPNRGFDFTSATLDGFTITNHVLATGNGAGGYGNAMTLVNCLLAGNHSLAGVGGGCQLAGATTVTNCVFQGNTSASYGGGLYFGGNGLHVASCQFTDNEVTRTDRYGGGVYVTSSYNCLFTNCQFTGNSAGRGGGFSTLNTVVTKGIITVTHCTVVSNTATANHGGGMYIDGGTFAQFCAITDNTVASTTSGQGAGVGGGGSLRNCLVARNHSNYRAGGYYDTSGSVIENCTIVDNSASTSIGGVYFMADSGAGTNNIIYHNRAPTSPNYLHVNGDTGLVHSCVFPAVSGAGNIADAPRLVDLAAGDFRLLPASPCVDGGVDLAWMEGAVDLDGNPRIRFGASRGTVDMGAYESLHPIGSVLLLR